MSNSSQSVILIAESESVPLNPTQRKYNALLKKIDKQQQTLSQWQHTHEEFHAQVVGRIVPLQEILSQEQRSLLIVLDNYLTHYKFNKQEKIKLHDLITRLCDALVGIIDDDDAQFLAIYERYQEEDDLLDDDNHEEEAMLRAEFKDFFGIELDESVDLNDPASVMRYLFEQKSQQEEALAEAERHAPPRKKTSKQLAKEAKAQAEAEAAQQSIQSIYRDLVKNLHPDRESDPVAREQKTQLMQEVTVAYQEKNLIRLLELQQTQTQRQQSLHQLSDDRIKAFIRLLEKQLEQLKTQTEEIQDRCRMQIGLSAYDTISPQKLQRCVKSDIDKLKHRSWQIREDRKAFEKDINYLKKWLKDYD